MMKKAGFVAATAVGLMMIGGTAFASPSVPTHTADPTFHSANVTSTEGGGALGHDAASLVAGVHIGIVLTPALILHLLCHDHDYDHDHD